VSVGAKRDDGRNDEGSGLAADLRAVYGAYQFLRGHDLAAVSATSRRLREADLPALAARLRDEVGELRGVIAGTHGHGGGGDDVVLEASQCLYWTFVLAVAAGDAYDDLSPHLALTGATHDAGATTVPDDAVDLTDPSTRRETLRAVLSTVGALCRQRGVDPHAAVARDRADLHTRPYLDAYWASSAPLTNAD